MGRLIMLSSRFLCGALLLSGIACSMACVPPLLPPEVALKSSPWSVTRILTVETMNGKKTFGSITADMLQLDSIWKWTDDSGDIVASAAESMLKYNAFMHAADKPIVFTVKDCQRQPLGYVRELKQAQATQTWGRAYEYQILDLNHSVTARTQAGLGMDLSMRILSANNGQLLALVDRPSSRFENEWRIKVVQPGMLGSDVRALILIAGQSYFRGGDLNFLPVFLIAFFLFCTVGIICGVACHICKQDKTIVYGPQ